jgi:pimeloyl-ACP methyl ester carboxylesterase
MDANVWAKPEIARVLGGKYSLRILLGDIEMRSSFDDIRDLGLSVLTWSQRRPVGDAAVAMGELEEIVKDVASDDLILIGHSRGGLLARKLIEQNIHRIKMIVTIAAPHHGSTVAKWASHISPLAATLKKIIDTGQRKESASAIQRILGFLSGSGIREMLPESDFIGSLSSLPVQGVKTISIGGTDPSLIRINGKSFSEMVSGILPVSMLPEELLEGKGDGFVSAASSVWPGAGEHLNFHAHHARLIFDPGVRAFIKEKISTHISE